MEIIDIPFSRRFSLSNITNKYIQGEWSVIDSQTQQKICEFDTFIGYNATDSSSVPINQIEEGSFAAYNKINKAKEFTVTLAKSGRSGLLRSVLNVLEEYKSSTNLVDLVLPYRTYIGLNIEDLGHGISEGAAVNLLVVELKLKEIRQVSAVYKSVSFKNVKSAGDADTVNKGRIQAQGKDESILRSLGLKL